MVGHGDLQTIINSFATECKTLFGDKLLDIKLYGSYARGDQEEYSDIDLLILLDIDDADARKYLSPICSIASEIDLTFNVLLSPFICGKDQYDKLKDFPGFYSNIQGEGVSVYAG